MPERTPITAERLRSLLHYCPETGTFTWLVKRGPCAAGTTAGTVTDGGYRQIRVDGTIYKEHRLAWLYMTGEMPPSVVEVDHRDGNPGRNVWSNLRLGTSSENSQNIHGPHADSATGVLGVSLYKGGPRFRARIFVDGREKSLGVYDRAEDAHAAYLKAKRSLHAFCVL